MKRLFAAIMSVAVFGALAPVVDAQSSCPAEEQQAKEMFGEVAKTPDDQAARTVTGARQELQGQRDKEDAQAKQEVDGPRSKAEVQAPRGKQDVQAPRGKEDVQ